MYGLGNQEVDMPRMAGQTLDRHKPITIRHELVAEIKHLEDRIATKKAMLSLLDSNPAIEQFIDLSRQS